MNRRELQLEKLLAPTVEGMGCELWGVEYLSQGKRSLLRLYIDSQSGVTADDCARVSHQVSGVLDVEDPISDRYVLEVSSPGLDRILFKPSQYLAHVGAEVQVRLNVPFEGRRQLVGVLVGLEDDEIVLRVGDEEFVLPLEHVQRTRVVPRFE